MKNSPFIAFIKKILFTKLDWRVIFAIAYLFIIALDCTALATHLISFHTYNIIFGILMAVWIIVGAVDIFRTYYLSYKKYEYPISHLPEQLEKIESIIQPDVWTLLRKQEERIEKLEKESPVKLAILSFFLAIFLAVSIGVVFYLLPQIMTH